MDHSLHAPLEAFELNELNLVGVPVYGPGDEKVGNVTGIDREETSLLVVVEIGGFLGIGAKSVGLAITDINFMRDEDGNVHGVTSWTKEALKETPEVGQREAGLPLPPIM